MTSSDPESVLPNLPVDAPSGSPRLPPSAAGEVAGGPARSPRSVWGWTLTAGALAGLSSWLGGEMIYGRFEVPPAASSAVSQSPETIARAARVRLVSHMKEGGTTFGLLGATLGLALGLSGGLLRRNVRAALVAAGAGLLLGGASGTVAGLGLVRVFYRYDDFLSDSLIFPMLVHGAIWTTIGLAGGLAFGIGLGGWRRIVRAASGGLLGAICGTIFYELAGALAFPLAKTDFPTSTSVASRLLALLAVALFIAAGAASGAHEPRSGPEPKRSAVAGSAGSETRAEH